MVSSYLLTLQHTVSLTRLLGRLPFTIRPFVLLSATRALEPERVEERDAHCNSFRWRPCDGVGQHLPLKQCWRQSQCRDLKIMQAAAVPYLQSLGLNSVHPDDSTRPHSLTDTTSGSRVQRVERLACRSETQPS